MSMTYTSNLGYQTTALTDALYAQPDPLKRLLDATIMQRNIYRLLQQIRQEAAYEARQVLSSGQIADYLEMDRKTVDYLVRRYLETHPYKEPPTRKMRQKVTSFVDLSRKESPETTE